VSGVANDLLCNNRRSTVGLGGRSNKEKIAKLPKLQGQAG